jgi:hypothetical protein
MGYPVTIPDINTISQEDRGFETHANSRPSMASFADTSSAMGRHPLSKKSYRMPISFSDDTTCTAAYLSVSRRFPFKYVFTHLKAV